ncbi:uncharacterized protein EKO05_0004600 [Ascochyta rabiei]|uniref:Oxidoreductase n=1 Tax=Didymella rabiei TaxID=5454 RepID=A0A163EZW5_DIDRA|nr:uncharacterized protein EKO05_0004600 [Ascochyta rabiei]KZM24046.1 oxidoreductase [Ascochyta rabiei]UPX14109.1 hypothetical protein EKO05_0004600 [Ascochyta rabiei]
MAAFMIYGAGYTGELTCEYAKSVGLDFVIAGRHESKVTAVATRFQVESRIFALDNSVADGTALNGIQVLLNCAGPFSQTVGFLVKACIQRGVHYLDVSAELGTYRLVQRLHEDAVKANTMLMPGGGASVALLGCLAARVLEDVNQPYSVDVALQVSGPMSRGSVMSSAESVTVDCLQRLRGELVPQDTGSTKDFDFDDGNGTVTCFPVTLPDLITIWLSSGVPNIRIFVHALGTFDSTGDISSLPDGPTTEQRDENPYRAAAVVTAADGTVKRAVLQSVNGYTFTSVASVQAAKRILNGQVVAGYQTPFAVFGSDFAEVITGFRTRFI